MRELNRDHIMYFDSLRDFLTSGTDLASSDAGLGDILLFKLNLLNLTASLILIAVLSCRVPQGATTIALVTRPLAHEDNTGITLSSDLVVLAGALNGPGLANLAPIDAPFPTRRDEEDHTPGNPNALLLQNTPGRQGSLVLQKVSNLLRGVEATVRALLTRRLHGIESRD